MPEAEFVGAKKTPLSITRSVGHCRLIPRLFLLRVNSNFDCCLHSWSFINCLLLRIQVV